MRRAALLLLALAACGPPARSTAWFVQHPDTAASVANACAAKTAAGPECANAHAAIRQAQVKRLKLFRKGF